jgi:hypothetical protein
MYRIRFHVKARSYPKNPQTLLSRFPAPRDRFFKFGSSSRTLLAAAVDQVFSGVRRIDSPTQQSFQRLFLSSQVEPPQRIPSIVNRIPISCMHQKNSTRQLYRRVEAICQGSMRSRFGNKISVRSPLNGRQLFVPSSSADHEKKEPSQSSRCNG